MFDKNDTHSTISHENYHNGLRKQKVLGRNRKRICADGRKENDYNLNIPRYVDTYEEEAEIDLAEVQQKIAQLQNELADVQKQMDEYLKLF
jgi:type I restriction enzyme M protein